MPRLVRRRGLIERAKAYLDPYDLLLWLSEELNDDAYGEVLQEWATPIGVVLNIVFILARGAGTARATSRGGDADDVFVFGPADGRRGGAWWAGGAAFLTQLLTVLCCLNALYTFLRTRHYRLFEHPVDAAPATSSARRVRVDSSPLSASPLRYLHNIIASTSAAAASRAYPDATREVWELSLWDPKPLNLTLFTLFSPAHVLLYFSLLPAAIHDPRPSITIFIAVAFGAVLSLQLSLLTSSFTQQAKDSALIHGQVLNEYDTKFVRPTLQSPVRDVGIQTQVRAPSPSQPRAREVDVYPPTTIVNRGFHTNPNPNYAAQYDPDNLLNTPRQPRPDSSAQPRRQSTSLFASRGTSTPTTAYTNGTTSAAYSRPTPADLSSPLKSHHDRLRDRVPASGDGGSFGVYSHAASPLRKAASAGTLLHPEAAPERTPRGPSSPLKRTSASIIGRGGDGDAAAAGVRRETRRF